MTRIQWGREEDKSVQGGLDRGVLYPIDKPAVAWNGLVSVQESGSQQSSSYYVDGRKFLTTVTPREYSATLSAITFPDEFAEICGIIEAADGLFLDSQVPDQFGLSYRTMYGDGKHYKIHILYGVTASMSDVQYETLSSSANDPTPFEFAISAIPQPIAGFRPTSHVMVDTKHIDPEVMANIENLLYGGYGQEAQLPSIQSLYEMMGYGDVVVIHDNGNGTWTAEGSYRNVSLNRLTGEFTISNVPVINYEDGTYDVASTDETIVRSKLDGGFVSSTSTSIVDGGSPADTGDSVITDGGSA